MMVWLIATRHVSHNNQVRKIHPSGARPRANPPSPKYLATANPLPKDRAIKYEIGVRTVNCAVVE